MNEPRKKRDEGLLEEHMAWLSILEGESTDERDVGRLVVPSAYRDASKPRERQG